MPRKEEGQPFSQDGWPILRTLHRYRFVPKTSGSAILCVLWQKPETC